MATLVWLMPIAAAIVRALQCVASGGVSLAVLAITFCLSFVQAFSVFPSAVLLGAPAGPTRVISIAAYQAAFEEYDYSLASAIAMIMGTVQLSIVVLVLSLRGLLYRGPAGGGKG